MDIWSSLNVKIEEKSVPKSPLFISLLTDTSSLRSCLIYSSTFNSLTCRSARVPGRGEWDSKGGSREGRGRGRGGRSNGRSQSQSQGSPVAPNGMLMSQISYPPHLQGVMQFRQPIDPRYQQAMPMYYPSTQATQPIWYPSAAYANGNPAQNTLPRTGVEEAVRKQVTSFVQL